MKAAFTFCLLFLCSFPVFAQPSDHVLATFKSIGDLTEADAALYSSRPAQGLCSFQPVTMLYKNSNWYLTVVDTPEEKLVLHFSDKQLKAIDAIVAARDGKTHYLEITNFFEIFSGHERAEVDQAFLSRMLAAIYQMRWYRNNAVFMISATLVDEQPVVRFKLPFYNEQRVRRHTRQVHNLQNGYFETSPAHFMRLLVADASH